MCELGIQVRSRVSGSYQWFPGFSEEMMVKLKALQASKEMRHRYLGDEEDGERELACFTPVHRRSLFFQKMAPGLLAAPHV